MRGYYIMKKNIKKLFTLFLALTICFSLFACNERPLSAYDIAVENGFVGSEQEWLESLKGEDGRDGESGKDGQNAAITIEEIYASAVKAGYDKDFLTFIQEYLSISSTEYATEDAVNKALFSAVDVIAVFKVLQNGVITEGGSSGSGVIYQLDKEAGDALIITNYHVVYNKAAYGVSKIAPDIRIYLYGSELEDYRINATYVGGSMTYDIAVLKVENSEVLKNSSATQVTIADSNKVKVGSTAIAIGNSDGEGLSATVGRVSVDSEYITMLGADEATTITFRCMRIDAAVNPGNSGGGLFNAKGELIGIVNAKTVDSDIEGMGYAIPSTLAINVAENIIWNSSSGKQTVSKGLMGVTVAAKESKAVFNEELQMAEIIETVVVEEVSAGALVSGILQKDDIIVSIAHNGVETKCTRMYIVVDYMLSVRPGEQITITFIRNGVVMQETVTILSKHFTEIA